MIRSAQITAFYLFEVSESVALDRLPGLLQATAQRARLTSKPAVPSYVRYQVPPLQVDGESIGFQTVNGYQARFKIFDYGVVSLALTRSFSGAWEELTGIAHQISAGNALEGEAERLARELVHRMQPALDQPRDRFLSEDFVVFSVNADAQSAPAEQLLEESGTQIAQLLRAEIEPLSTQERQEVLRHRMSYLANDLVVLTWSSAFVYDTEEGIQGAQEIMEYSNSQLLQFRYYDRLLDDQLAAIYRELEGTLSYRNWWPPRRYTHPARRVHALFIDVNELTDRTENALKLVGDVYAARLLALANSRLGVTSWRESVKDKLKTLDGIYRFAVDQTGMERGELLELAIVVILVFELVLFFMGIMK